jgi:hypothetical protein
MTGLGVVTAQHSMLDIVNCVIISRYIVVEGLLITASHEGTQPLEHGTFGFRLVALRHHFEKHVHIHALIDVQEKGNSFGWVQLGDIDFL